jgi:uncharacterized protein
MMAKKTVRLAPGLSLPVDIVTESIACLAIKRAGKSSTCRRIVEQLYDAGQQVVVLDPKGDWWGIQFGRDGHSPGLPFVVVGGEHGQVPLTGDFLKLGEIVARMAAVERVNMVIDLGSLRKHEVTKFCTFFLETLYRIKAQDAYRTPMMLVCDEADVIAPQKIVSTGGKENLEPRMLGAAEDIVRRGGQRGIGIILATQRSAVLNKNVLTQCGILLALRTVATQDIKPIDDWVEKHGTQEQYEQLLASIASLPAGTGWVWSSHFPAPNGTFKKVSFELFETFDSFATPKVGEKAIVPKNRADIDLDAFKREMAETFEKAAQEDPKELHRQIRDLKAELKKKPAAAPTAKSAAHTAELQTAKAQLRGTKRVLEEALKLIVNVKTHGFAIGDAVKQAELTKAIESVVARVTKSIEDSMAGHLKKAEGIKQQADRLEKSIKALADGTIDLTLNVSAQEPFKVTKEPSKRDRSDGQAPSLRHLSAPKGEGTGEMTQMERNMMIALAQHQDGLQKNQILLHTGYSSSGNTSKAFASLISNGWAEAPSSGSLRITQAGIDALGSYDPLPLGRELQEFLLNSNKLSQMEKGILRVLCGVHPDPMQKGELLRQANYSSSGNTPKAFARLVRYGYAESAGSAMLKASDTLFD